MALSLGSSLVKATETWVGKKVTGTVTINQRTLGSSTSNDSDLYTITLNNTPLTYNGGPQRLINSVTKTNASNGTTLYLRVSNSETPAASSNKWTEVNENTDFATTLTGTNSRTYYVYYYIQTEGNDNYTWDASQ